MRRVALVLPVLLALAISSCATGVRAPASDVTTTGATLNGSVVSTTGGPGSWYFEYGTTAERTERTPVASIDLEAGKPVPVSEQADGLEPGTTYHFAACAEDSENAGRPSCSPDQTFTTDYDPVLSLEPYCEGYIGVIFHLTGMPPNEPFHGRFDFPNDSGAYGDFTTDADGDFELGPVGTGSPGTYTATIEWAGGTLTKSEFVDCAAALFQH